MPQSSPTTTEESQLSLPQAGVDLWFCRPEIFASDSSLLARYEGLIDEVEYEHYRRLRFPDHKLEYLASHAMLRYVLTLYYPAMAPGDWAFQRNAHGKPSLVDEQARDFPLAFNLSHTHGIALCGVAVGGELGVDVEYHANSQGLLDVADHYFSDLEVRDLFELEKAEQEHCFFHYWTLKEAFIKARGEGLAIPLDSFSFVLNAAQIGFIPPADALGAEHDWHFRLFHTGDRHTAALAWNREVGEVRLFEANPLLNYQVRDTNAAWL